MSDTIEQRAKELYEEDCHRWHSQGACGIWTWQEVKTHPAFAEKYYNVSKAEQPASQALLGKKKEELQK